MPAHSTGFEANMEGANEPDARNSLLRKVPTQELKGRQLRSEFSGSNIKRLKRRMQRDGFDQRFPIDIAEVDGIKIIIDGHHRARAAGAARIREVPVRVNQVTPEQAGLLLKQAAEATENHGL